MFLSLKGLARKKFGKRCYSMFTTFLFFIIIADILSSPNLPNLLSRDIILGSQSQINLQKLTIRVGRGEVGKSSCISLNIDSIIWPIYIILLFDYNVIEFIILWSVCPEWQNIIRLPVWFPLPHYHHRYNYSDVSQKNCLCQNQVNRPGVFFFFFANVSVKFKSTCESPRDFAIAIQYAFIYTASTPICTKICHDRFSKHIPETIVLLMFTPCARPICLRRW